MTSRAKPQNFDGLLAAWLDALNTDALTDKFYKDLFAWFQRAVKDAKFPQDEAKTLSAEEHIIRLITRILFVWFIKEKGLVSADLFIQERVETLLKDYDAANGDSYYRAVLQNLFFATLNTEIARREFSSETQTTHRDFSRWRYKSQIADPHALAALFGETPFINGGLFDCLDSEPATSDGGYRIDCFSDVHYAKLSIPNRLFFDERDGLIPLFDRYKFTVEENTPLEQEVALDPELLGNVFENLLAAHTPETADTARKQTGSYYTPRAVVDYMVDESLASALAEKIAPAGDNAANNDADNAAADNAENKRRLAERLRQLLDYAHPYEDAPDPFTPDEREAIVKAVAELKIIDPAVGSGAFPMGILHKLTLALRRVDPDNKRWERLQIEIAGDRARDAFETPGESERNAELAEISRIFERYRDSDFGRKLYLIQNSIYGVDIQPVAAQIAKLRFFISLAIEQTPDRAAPNYGIRPLPNLETRFIAADALIGLRGLQGLLPVREIDGLQSQLRRNRENHFHAGTRRAKQRYSRQDKRLRAQLQAALQKYDFPAADAAKIADWDAFDHNAPAAQWFDAKYMFGVDSGFDVVIGNPPYVVSKNTQLRSIYKEGIFGRMNLYGVFIQRGLQLLDEGGQLAFINPRTLLTDRYFTNLRKVVKRDAELRGVVMIADRHNTFASVLQECILLQLERRETPSDSYPVNTRAVHIPSDLTDPLATNSENSSRVLLGDNYHGAFYIGNSDIEYEAMERMSATGVSLADLGLNAATGKVQFDKYRQYAQPTNANKACRLIWAENTQRYAWRAAEKRVGKEWLSDQFTSVMPPNITGAGIVTQRISANEQPRRIIASLVTPAIAGSSVAYSENHTNFIPLEDETKGAFLLAALNSSPMEFIFRRLNSNTQVSAGELNTLPFPSIPNDDALAEIAGIVSELLRDGGVDCDTASAARLIALERELDILVGALYGFSAGEVEQMQGMLASYEVVYGVGR